jgi:hypothetical protein
MGVISSFLKMATGGKLMSGGAIGGITMGGMTYMADRMSDPHESRSKALAKAGVETAGWVFAEPLMWGMQIGQGAVWAGKQMFDEADKNLRQEQSIQFHVRKDRSGANAGTLGGNFQDSQNAYTMRQRQMELLRQHKMATESILGSEARQLHR